MRGAPETLNTKPDGREERVAAASTPSEDPSTPDAVNIATVIVSSDFGGGTIDLYPDGTIKEIYRNSRLSRTH